MLIQNLIDRNICVQDHTREAVAYDLHQIKVLALYQVWVKRLANAGRWILILN